MKVALTDKRGTRIEEAPDPECGPGDVVCRVLACAAGDADLGAALPAVLGSEPAGEVVAVGAGAVNAGGVIVGSAGSAGTSGGVKVGGVGATGAPPFAAASPPRPTPRAAPSEGPRI